jgi:hypothetical protein
MLTALAARSAAPMAPVDLSGVLALCRKAVHAQGKGHFARAAEQYSAAVDAARALQQPADCLVLACVQARQARCTMLHSQMASVQFAEMVSLMCTTVGIADEAATVLQRRRTAGTLMGAGLRATEQQFALAFSDILCPTDAAMNAPLQYVEAYILVASIFVIHSAALFSSEQRRARFDFAATALDLLLTHPVAILATLPNAVLPLASLVRSFKCEGLMASPDASGLAAAWQRLQRSGNLDDQRMDKHEEDANRLGHRLGATLAAQVAARGLRGCALAGCDAREVHVAQFKKCAACQAVVYCCKAHQEADWPAHKATCKAARRAAAQGGAGPNSGA